MTNSTEMISLQEQLAAEASQIAKRIQAPGGDRIRYNKQNLMVLPDSLEVEELEVVMVDFVSSNLFYDRPYDSKNPGPPACFAIGPEPMNLVPSKNSPAIQSNTCKECPNNKFGSHGDGKACKNTRLVAVVPYESLAMGDPQLWVASIPPTSVRFLDAYVQTLSVKHKTTPIGVKTLFSLEPKAEYASPRFKVIAPLDEEDLKTAMSLRDTARARLLTEPDVTQYQPPAKAKGPRGAVAR